MVPKCILCMFSKLTNEHLIHTAVNTACIILSLSFPFNSCCFARYEADVFISLSERKCLQLWQVPPEPVALLVSMVVLQAAPWADCAQGPLQPVFFFSLSMICSPEAGVKLQAK